MVDAGIVALSNRLRSANDCGLLRSTRQILLHTTELNRGAHHSTERHAWMVRNPREILMHKFWNFMESWSIFERMFLADEATFWETDSYHAPR
jgi:hypothetical protein